jgi:hypothetical protein
MAKRQDHPERDKRQGSARTIGGRTSRPKGPSRRTAEEPFPPGDPEAVRSRPRRIGQAALPALSGRPAAAVPKTAARRSGPDLAGGNRTRGNRTGGNSTSGNRAGEDRAGGKRAQRLDRKVRVRRKKTAGGGRLRKPARKSRRASPRSGSRSNAR